MRTTRSALPVLPAPSQARPHAGPAPLPTTTIRLHTLGCDKNTVDSERILARLAGAGAVTSDGEAEVVIVNTCGFIDAAREESVDAILDAVRLKDEGRAKAVVALGCLVQRYKAELLHEIPEVDLFLGLTEVERLVPELRRRGLLHDAPPAAANMEQPLRLLTTDRHSSFLKISEGCDHGCAFCAIPVMRGRHRSTPIDVLVREARQLEAAGVVELSLVSQDTTWYGRDIQRGGAAGPDEWFVGRPYSGMAGGSAARSAFEAAGRPRGPAAGRRDGLLTELLDALLDETDIPWLRLFYMYPSGIRPELVERIAAEPRIVNYLDMPIQHGADTMLKRMRRPERQATIRERVAWLRSAIPDVALRTTVIVGFPGETEDDFEAMLELLEEIAFDHLGAFAYSVEEGTPAATMDGQVPEPVRRERLERVLDLQRSISLEKNESRIDTVHTVLVDRVTGRDIDDGMPGPGRGATGRTSGQALEVDGVVHVESAGDARPGDFVRVRITGAFEQDLVGTIVDADAG